MSEEQKTEQTEAVKTGVKANDTAKDAGLDPKTEAPAKVETTKTAKTGADASKTESSARPRRTGYQGKGGARRTGGKKPFRKGSRFGNRPKPEFDQKIINISRVTRVVKGGRRLSFRVDMIIGDKKGRVGLGSGKATDTSIAIQKSIVQARKNLLYLKLTKNNSIPYESSARVTSSDVNMMPNKQRGLVAGSTMRSVLKLAGITDVTAQVHSRSKNKLNNAKAAIEALRVFEMSDAEKEVLKKKLAEKRRAEMGNDRGGRGGRGGFRRGEQGGRKPFNRAPRTATNTK